MEPTQKPITVVYRVALLSLVVMAAFVLLIIFGHRGHKAAALADPLIVAAKYVKPLTGHAHHRSTMALSTTGYTASGAGDAAENGNYVPCAAPNATWNGATQYTNGSRFLTFDAGASQWGIYFVANLSSHPYPDYYSPSASATTFPLSGWTPLSTAPAPTFAVISGGGGTVATRRPPIFF